VAERLVSAFLAYAVAVAAFIACAAWLPDAIKAVAFALAVPLFIVFKPLSPLFIRFGLMEGEWLRLPSAGGILLGAVLYAVPLYAIARAARRLRQSR
jgi:hypothetical protein